MSFIDVARVPDLVRIVDEGGVRALEGRGEGVWRGGAVEVLTRLGDGGVDVHLSSPRTAMRYVQLRWRGELDSDAVFLGDAWERSYGELGWRGWEPQRGMPWYVVVSEGERTHGYGVRVRPGAMCFWQVDPRGISLWLDVRNGGQGVHLGERQLHMATVVSRQGQTGESAFDALRALCRLMCPSPRLPREPVYGSNDWYYAYGHNSESSILDDCKRMVELSPSGPNRPFTVIDAGWQPSGITGGGPWDHGTPLFPSMPGVAEQIKRHGARPGIWIRPLLAAPNQPDNWLLPREHWLHATSERVLDPTLAEVKHQVHRDIDRLREWGYELIKHDFTCYDVLGRWGFDMGTAVTSDNWCFTDRSRTNAEVLVDLYQTIRDAAGEALVLGCNTPTHLSAGLFELQRIGDDTSGRVWERTRRMGINTLAFRAAQHDAFYAVDADCVGLTDAIPWELNRQWLELLAGSGTPLFVSPDPKAIGPEQASALREAFAIAAERQPLGEPLDWRQTTCPTRWQLMGQVRGFEWTAAEGDWPFSA